ncbi:sugar transferase [Rhodobacteraceae bacterium (ex Bugula neritina AB1)]|nr:sugar transferase [Rhodobacteraceae bacterium (ex Bugula neritina AB1)]
MTMHYRETSPPHLHAQARPLATPLSTSAAASTAPLYRSFGKRALDLILCILGAPFALLLVGVLALLVARDGGKPFYSQLRVGQHGRTYRMWKLRSMVPDADQKLEAHLAQNPAARAEWDKDQKLKSDPRVTPLGAFLRRASIDELPQLWNVFKGDMSLVGPRPMMVDQQLLYPGRDYYDLRPGITGSWQVSHRNESSFAERAVFDTEYNRKVSFGEDLRILTATVRVVLKATGY